MGELRNERTRKVIDQTDLALLVLNDNCDLLIEKEWLNVLNSLEIPVVIVLNKSDQIQDIDKATYKIKEILGIEPIPVSSKNKEGIDKLKAAMAQIAGLEDEESITGSLAKAGDTVLLVMPQDPQAPKGRLILPQVQTIRDLLDKQCNVMCCGLDTLDNCLKALKNPPSLIITDSQVFRQVYEKKPQGTKLTSFSVLMASTKGNIKALLQGAQAIDRLNPDSKVLIAEACTHAPMSEDIGRVKIPRIIRKKYGENIKFDIHAGKDYPDDLKKYDLIIHCGACMFNRHLMLSRIERAQQQSIPITNYGLAIAKLQGILDEVSLP